MSWASDRHMPDIWMSYSPKKVIVIRSCFSVATLYFQVSHLPPLSLPYRHVYYQHVISIGTAAPRHLKDFALTLLTGTDVFRSDDSMFVDTKGFGSEHITPCKHTVNLFILHLIWSGYSILDATECQYVEGFPFSMSALNSTIPVRMYCPLRYFMHQSTWLWMGIDGLTN